MLGVSAKQELGRASLVALPRGMRGDYARVLLRRLPEHAPMLLITLDYPQREMRGPPFSVPPNEVERLFAPRFELSPIHAEDCLAAEPRFRAKGLSRMEEQLYLLRRRQTE